MPRAVPVAGLLASVLLNGTSWAAPIFENSVVSHDIDLITADDPAVPACLHYVGQTLQEMPGALHTNDLMASDVYTFDASFADNSKLGIWAHPSVGTREDAEKLAAVLLGPLGRLPAVLRQRLTHVVVQSGDHTSFAEDKGHFFVTYAENIRSRISTHDLEETVFHESVHAALQDQWEESAAWREAQKADNAFVTEYAAKLPHREDLSESALFAFAYLRHPERLPPEVRRSIETIMPARVSFFRTIFETPEPDVSAVEMPKDCLAR